MRLLLTSLLLFCNIVSATTLSWTAPTENVDNTPLTNLSGYNIRWQCNSRETKYVQIQNPAITSYVIPSNVVGMCDFWVNAYNEYDIVSEWSNKASKLIKLDKPTTGGIR